MQMTKPNSTNSCPPSSNRSGAKWLAAISTSPLSPNPSSSPIPSPSASVSPGKLILPHSDYFYTDPYLNEAANCPDPLLRMQLVVTDLIASIHHTHVLLKSLAPVDCILGETVTRVKPDGTRFYSEFIKADPPTTIFQVYGPNDAWVMYGVDEVEAQIHPTLTQLIGRNKRPRYLKFRDGKIYEIWLPTMIVNGLMKGDRILNKMDMATVKCPQDKLVTQINFSYVFEGQMAKMKNRLMFWNQQEKPISDLVDVKINKIINVN